MKTSLKSNLLWSFLKQFELLFTPTSGHTDCSDIYKEKCRLSAQNENEQLTGKEAMVERLLRKDLIGGIEFSWHNVNIEAHAKGG